MCDSIQSGIHVRWAIRLDMPHVLRIERESFADPWGEAEFVQVMRERDVIVLVAESRCRVLGFIVYRAEPTCYRILDLAIAKEFRRQRIASALLNRLRSKLAPGRRREVISLVTEENLAAQLFFRSCDARCEQIVRRPYRSSESDGYLFRIPIRKPQGAAT